jgi:hypothetical protein
MNKSNADLFVSEGFHPVQPVVVVSQEQLEVPTGLPGGHWQVSAVQHKPDLHWYSYRIRQGQESTLLYWLASWLFFKRKKISF